jgi:hypothetical protein
MACLRERSGGQAKSKWQNSNGLQCVNFKLINLKPLAICSLPFAI